MSESVNGKFSRSRSKGFKSDTDSIILKLYRKTPLVVPEKIFFFRGPNQKSSQVVLEVNKWISMPESLTKILCQEHDLIFESNASHSFPPQPSTLSVANFLMKFELSMYDPDNVIQSGVIKAFTASISSMFSNSVINCLLYDKESRFLDAIRLNPLQNTPAIIILRFLYIIPNLMKNENTESDISCFVQTHLKHLTAFAEKNAQHFFLLPSVHHSNKTSSSIGIKSASKTNNRSNLTLIVK